MRGIVSLVVAVGVLLSGAPAGAHGRAYTIRPGDTLSEIARRLAVSIQTLVAVNSIVDRDRIFAGEVLELPGDGSTSATTHVVAAGETLSEIAARYGVTVEQLAAVNGIEDRDLVWEGDRLVVSADAPALPTAVTRATHTVQPGETLSEIAAAYGTTIADLVAANGLENRDFILAGTSLSVPGGWRCPVPEVSRFVDDFDVVKPDGRHHDGVDLFAPRGSPVVAPVSGEIRQDEGSRGGLQVWLLGDDGHHYFGSHLDSFGAAGRVSAGEVIGTVGDSGNARGADPHLHFQIHPGGGPPANPYLILVEACPV